MKTLGLIIVLAAGVLTMTLILIPIGVSIHVLADESGTATVMGKLRVAQVIVQNEGWFTQTVRIPEYTSCIGDQEIPLDAWLATDEGIVRGTGQVQLVRVRPGDSGIVYLIASDVHFSETVSVYERTPYFSCLTANAPVS